MSTRAERLGRWSIVAVTAFTISACQKSTSNTLQQSPASARALSGSLADPAQLQQDDGQWVMSAKNYAATRFSALNEITAANVKQMGVAWTFSTGVTAGHEGPPLVVGDTMYLVTPWPNILYAFDLTKPGAPMKWQYDPKPLGAAKGVACCDLVNRGAAYANGAIFFNALDGRTISVDATTGRERWTTQLADINRSTRGLTSVQR